MRICGKRWVLLLLLPATAAFAQSLGDVARKEKKRREQNQHDGAVVHVVGESEVRTGRGPGGASSSSIATPVDLMDGGSAGDASAEAPSTAMAPDFALPDRTGRPVSLRELRGRPVLIDFWASWCGPCKQTMPEIEKIHRKYGAKLQVVGINIEGRTPEALAYLDQGGYSFRILFDGGNWKGTTVASYGVTSIPRTFLIDREGRIVFAGHPSGLSRARIEAALGAPGE